MLLTFFALVDRSQGHRRGPKRKRAKRRGWTGAEVGVRAVVESRCNGSCDWLWECESIVNGLMAVHNGQEWNEGMRGEEQRRAKSKGVKW